MKILKSFFGEVFLIEIFNQNDKRGKFLKLFNSRIFKQKIKNNFIVREAFLSNSAKGTIRGMHYDTLVTKNNKLIYCNKGKIFDVVLNIRKNSKHYGKYFCIDLKGEDNKLLYVPYGYAHGFQALKNNTEVFYFSSANYNKKNERGYAWNSFGCKWPITNKNNIFLSKRDLKHKNFNI